MLRHSCAWLPSMFILAVCDTCSIFPMGFEDHVESCIDMRCGMVMDMLWGSVKYCAYVQQ